MTRKKKSTSGINGDLVFVRKRNRKPEDMEGRLRKKQKKHKGLSSGSRYLSGEATSQATDHTPKDPRIGSKKPIPLVVDVKQYQISSAARLTAEQELAQIEQDSQLAALLARLDKGDKLGAGLQAYVDEKLDRLEVLMEQLGLLDEETTEPLEKPQTQPRQTKGSKTQEELLSEFERMNPEDWS